MIRERYFDFRYRPRILIENYAPIAGYYWINGSWYWDGAEWIWTPGHYEPDQSYVDPNYGADYPPTYTPSTPSVSAPSDPAYQTDPTYQTDPNYQPQEPVNGY